MQLWQSCFLGSAVRSWHKAYLIRRLLLSLSKVKNQRDLVPGHDGRLGVNTKSGATYLDEVKAANTVGALTHAKARWVRTPSLSLAVKVSSLLGKELPTDSTFRLSRRSSPLNVQLVILL